MVTSLVNLFGQKALIKMKIISTPWKKGKQLSFVAGDEGEYCVCGRTAITTLKLLENVSRYSTVRHFKWDFVDEFIMRIKVMEFSLFNIKIVPIVILMRTLMTNELMLSVNVGGKGALWEGYIEGCNFINFSLFLVFGNPYELIKRFFLSTEAIFRLNLTSWTFQFLCFFKNLVKTRRSH